MAKFFKKHAAISLAVQRERMRSLYSHFKCQGNHISVTFVGTLQPTPLCDAYEIEIDYKINDVPKVFVLRPKLKPRKENELIPHIYEANRLCLYLPGSGEWTPQKFIADTIVPWSSLWLFYYELWHATGEWLGGGVNPK